MHRRLRANVRTFRRPSARPTRIVVLLLGSVGDAVTACGLTE
jgi:hypothetical protein